MINNHTRKLWLSIYVPHLTAINLLHIWKISYFFRNLLRFQHFFQAWKASQWLFRIQDEHWELIHTLLGWATRPSPVKSVCSTALSLVKLRPWEQSPNVMSCDVISCDMGNPASPPGKSCAPSAASKTSSSSSSPSCQHRSKQRYPLDQHLPYSREGYRFGMDNF